MAASNLIASFSLVYHYVSMPALYPIRLRNNIQIDIRRTALGALLKIAGFVFILVLLVQSFDDEEAGPPKLSADEIKERRLNIDRMLAEQEAKNEAIYAALLGASDAELSDLISECRGAIEAYADSRNRGPFGIYIVDNTMADVYRYSADSDSLESIEQRISSFRESSNGVHSFNTQYSILSTSDSFDGPQKSITKYECEIGEDLTILRAKRAF